MNLSPVFITIYICTYCSTCMKISFLPFPPEKCMLVLLYSDISFEKSSLTPPGSADCSFLGWYISLSNAFHIDLQISFTYMSALRLNCQLLTAGTVSYSFLYSHHLLLCLSQLASYEKLIDLLSIKPSLLEQ